MSTTPSPTEQTILKVGSEGGCIELLSVETDGAWRFRLANNAVATFVPADRPSGIPHADL